MTSEAVIFCGRELIFSMRFENNIYVIKMHVKISRTSQNINATRKLFPIGIVPNTIPNGP